MAFHLQVATVPSPPTLELIETNPATTISVHFHHGRFQLLLLQLLAARLLVQVRKLLLVYGTAAVGVDQGEPLLR